MIKIYLYKDIEHTKTKKFPSFEIAGDVQKFISGCLRR